MIGGVEPSPFVAMPVDGNAESRSAPHIVLQRFAAVSGASPVISVPAVLQKKSPEVFLRDYYAACGVQITTLPGNPTQEIEKMCQLGEKFGSLIWCGAKADKLEQEMQTNPRFLQQRDICGNTFLHYVAERAGKLQGSGRSCGLLDFLLNRGADLRAKNCEGMTSLHLAAEQANDRVTARSILPFLVKEAVAKGFDFNQRDAHGRTVLHLAAQSAYSDWMIGSTDNVKVLLEAATPGKIDCSAKDALGLTPVDYAIIGNNKKALQTLLRAGADPLAGICAGKLDVNALLYAYHEREDQIAERRGVIFVEPQTEPNFHLNPISKLSLEDAIDFFHSAFKQRNLSKYLHAVVCNLLRNVVQSTPDFAMDARDRNGYTLLHVAAMSDQEDIIRDLLQKGATHRTNYNGVAPLDLAMMQNRDNAFVTLLAAGVPLPESMENDSTGKPIPYVVTCALQCKSSVILARVFDQNKSLLQNKFTIEFDDGRKEFSLLECQNYYAIFELLKRGLKFDLEKL